MINRRQILKTAFTAALGATASKLKADNSTEKCYPSEQALVHPSHLKVIPSTNEQITSVGMGTWITFDVDGNTRRQRRQVLQTFFDLGGQMIDSSPMYGNAEAVLGYCLKNTQRDCDLFSASKIWTPVTFDGRIQMENTETLWGIKPIDLMYVHNLVNWKNHLPQLVEWKLSGRIRYLGVSTSHGRRHDQLEEIIKTQKLDFVQLTYNYDNRETEKRLIPIANDNGVAVVVNRPFSRGHLIDKYKVTPLPGIAKEIGCETWAQYLLMFVVSHPGVTLAIPATSKVAHMQENMAVLQMELPDTQTRNQL